MKELIALIVVMLLERWLGKTKKIEANSIIEVFENIIKGKK